MKENLVFHYSNFVATISLENEGWFVFGSKWLVLEERFSRQASWDFFKTDTSLRSLFIHFLPAKCDLADEEDHFAGWPAPRQSGWSSISEQLFSNAPCNRTGHTPNWVVCHSRYGVYTDSFLWIKETLQPDLCIVRMYRSLRCSSRPYCTNKGIHQNRISGWDFSMWSGVPMCTFPRTSDCVKWAGPSRTGLMSKCSDSLQISCWNYLPYSRWTREDKYRLKQFLLRITLTVT